MRLKTFLSTFVLFLVILFSSLGVVSVYMSNNQIALLKEKSIAEYQTIVSSLAKDIAVLSGRNNVYAENINMLVNGYAKYYKKHGVSIELTKRKDDIFTDTVLSVVSSEQEYFICIAGMLLDPFGSYQLDYSYNATQSITEMQNIQKTLLFICIVFSVITAFALHFILLGIFRPLAMVAKTSRKIAEGQYNERIYIKGKNELSDMANDFNRMAEQIKKQIHLLEDEAIQKQQFVDNFAHEIRTPLTSIYGYAEYMQKAALSEEEMIESTQFIIDEAEHMKKIANSLLELATLQHYKPVKSNILISQLFETISQTLKNELEKHEVQLICKNDVNVLKAQEDLIKSLLLNLCTNALHACPANNGIIYLEAKRQGEKTILSVTDNGYGIPEESISKITEPFYRVDKSRSRENGGTGLGLALCRQIALAHDANLTVKSCVGMGTTIQITFTSS